MKENFTQMRRDHEENETKKTKENSNSTCALCGELFFFSISPNWFSLVNRAVVVDV